MAKWADAVVTKNIYIYCTSVFPGVLVYERVRKWRGAVYRISVDVLYMYSMYAYRYMYGLNVAQGRLHISSGKPDADNVVERDAHWDFAFYGEPEMDIRVESTFRVCVKECI